MRAKRAKLLKRQAREKAKDGSVISGHEYKRLKRSYNNPSYGPRVIPDGVSCAYGEDLSKATQRRPNQKKIKRPLR